MTATQKARLLRGPWSLIALLWVNLALDDAATHSWVSFGIDCGLVILSAILAASYWWEARQ